MGAEVKMPPLLPCPSAPLPRIFLDTLACWAIDFHRFAPWSKRCVRRRDVAQGESACLTRKRSAVQDRPSLPSI
jgi:hypothetical protein